MDDEDLAAVELTDVGSFIAAMRAGGWSVAVHNDYRLADEPHTFWLWTHPNGRWVRGEGRTDALALSQVQDTLRLAQPQHPATEAERDAATRLMEAAQNGKIRGDDVQTILDACWWRASQPPPASDGGLVAALERLCNAADTVGVEFFDTDDMPEDVEEMQTATLDARAALAKHRGQS